MNKILIHSNFNFNLYQLIDSKYFEIETSLVIGNCLSLKTTGNTRFSKLLEQCGICADSLKALDILNHGLIT